MATEGTAAAALTVTTAVAVADRPSADETTTAKA